MLVLCFFFYGSGYNRDLHVLTHSLPTRRSSGLCVLDAPVRPGHIVIEASGVGDPWQIAGIALAEPDLQLAAVVVLADAEQLPAQLADPYIGDTVRRQIMRADILLLNKEIGRAHV